MKALLVFLLAVAALTSALGPASAEPRRRSPVRDFVAPFLDQPPPAFVRPTPSSAADWARSGWIDGASPYNPEGSSNPQIPTF
jgi:hypothetical protein